jgi:hypothetical protein
MRNGKEGGFALLVTIVLVAFLVLILVGLATFTRVETQVAGNAQDVTKSRQNALMALNIAIGELQLHAGPDKQVTARADITAVAAPTQPYFTGTWDNTGALTSWLVSGNEINPTTGVTPATALDPAIGSYPYNDAAREVFVLGSNSVDIAAKRVRLAKQAVVAPAGAVPGFTTAQTVGNYAWWVGDEGIKASASLVDELATASPINYNNSIGGIPGGDPVGEDWSTETVKKERLNQMQLSRPRLEKILTSVVPDLAANITALPKVSGRNQLLFITGVPASPTATEVKTSFHDLTPLSRGVLADTVTGTLRSDLSGSTVTAGAITSYQKLASLATVPVTAPAGVEAEFYPVAPSSTTGVWPTYGLYPVMSEAGIRIGFSISGTQVALNYYLDAELWNPYAARLKMNATNTLRFSIKFPAAVNFLVKNTTDTTSQVVTIAANTTYSADIISTNVLEPGQVVRFRGGATMDLVSVGVAPASALMPGAATVTSPIDQVDVQSPVSNLLFTLELVDTVAATAPVPLQALTLGSAFQSELNILNSDPTPALGFGYEFNRDMRVWSQGTLAAYRDPRLPVMSGVTFEETTATPWSLTNPSSNAANGFGTGHLSDAARVVMFDLPRQEITSVAQLRHMIGAKSYELGSSWGGAVNNKFDNSFVSTVPRNFGAWPVNGSLPRPNRYLEIYTPEGVVAGTLTDLQSAANSARYQLIRGAFNINSTSISAWKAVLGSKITGWKHSGSAAGGIALDNAFFRTEHGAQQRTALSGTIPPLPATADLATLTDAQLLGATGRQLSAADVTNLATEIVRLLKTPPYGQPFVSLAQFVNSGLIQTAIDNIGLNNTLGSSGAGDVQLKYTAAGLTQADVIACIAPYMAARSDTFVVRAYGDVQNPATGGIEGRAWCEATVQRLPDLVSASAAVVATVINPPPATNPFGRRFKIISFRWLSLDDL